MTICNEYFVSNSPVCLQDPNAKGCRANPMIKSYKYIDDITHEIRHPCITNELSFTNYFIYMYLSLPVIPNGSIHSVHRSTSTCCSTGREVPGPDPYKLLHRRVYSKRDKNSRSSLVSCQCDVSISSW